MSRSLQLKPSGFPEIKNRPWALVLRQHDLSGTDYEEIAYVSDDIAKEIVEAGQVSWLYGEPDWERRARLRDLEKVRVLREQVDAIEAAGASHS